MRFHQIGGSSHSVRVEALESRQLLSVVEPSFAAPVSYNIGTQPSPSVPNVSQDGDATADFNGDGKLDLVVSHKADNSVYFLAGNGNGTFQPAVQQGVGEAIEGREFAGDFRIGWRSHSGCWPNTFRSIHWTGYCSAPVLP